MGVLQIETRSEKLRNLGGVSGVRHNTGKVQAAQIIGQAQDRLWESNKRLGDSVQNIGKALCETAVSMTEFDRKIRMDDFSMKYQAEMNAFMLGDGEKNKGAINEDFTDGKAWMEKVEAKRRETEAKLRQECGVTDWEWKRDGERLTHGFDEQWRARMASHAFQVNEKRSQVAATGRRDTIEQTLSMGDGTPEMYGDWYSARTNEAIAHHAGIRNNPETGSVEVYDQEIFDQFMRKGALSLVSKQWENKVKLTSSSCMEMEDRKAVEAYFDEQAKGWKKEDGTYNFAQFVKDKKVLAALGSQGLQGFDKSFEADWQKARRTAANNADTIFRQRKYQSHQDARDAEIQQMQTWDTMAQGGTPASDESKAEWYSELARKNSWSKDKDGIEHREADGAQYPLGKYDKDAQAYYLNKAEYWRTMAKKAKDQEIKEETKEAKELRTATENDLGFRLLAFKLTNDAQFTDDTEAMTEEEYSQYMKDRKQLCDEVMHRTKTHGISYAKSKEFMVILDKNFSAEEKEAARDFLAFFGFDRDTYSTLGAARKAVATHSGNTPESIGESSSIWTLGIKTKDWVSNEDCLKLFNGYMREMKAMPRGADKQAYTKMCLDHVAENSAKLDIESCINSFSTFGRQFTARDVKQTAENLKAISEKNNSTKKESK